MGERKVLNKYIPPDFDPSILPKFKRDRGKMMEIRMMLPFSLRCNTCSEFMYKGKKFNSKTQYVQGDDYMGIRKIRFLIKCTVCSAEIAFKTDPKNSDYECEWGASRNFEVWRDNENALEEAAKIREEEEKQDSMKSLENRTLDSKIEMDVLDALDEIKAVNQRHERVDTDSLLQRVILEKSSVDKDVKIESEEEILKSIRFGKRGEEKGAFDSIMKSVIDRSKNKQKSSELSHDCFVTNIRKKKKISISAVATTNGEHEISTEHQLCKPNNKASIHKSEQGSTTDTNSTSITGLLQSYGSDGSQE